ncbi:hypothetical protein RR48_03666 [Papilio machaon]|uniref:Uncharacterized protein n=1 Tax=Papilio machaon TaxID=76193 RepID=A0A0N1IG84_PAPMA|nr:hypothetical protein RR48_03666 [Papilio machaon]
MNTFLRNREWCIAIKSEEYLKEKKFDAELFASARSTALFEVVEQEKCPADVVHHSLLNYLRRVSPTYNRSVMYSSFI